MRSDSGHQAAVLGAGSWGTALAIHLASVGHGVTLWGRDAALIEEMQDRRANPTYLPDITFPPLLRPVAALDEALAGARHVIVAVPSHGLRAVVRAAATRFPAVRCSSARRKVSRRDRCSGCRRSSRTKPVTGTQWSCSRGRVSRRRSRAICRRRWWPHRRTNAPSSRFRTNFADRLFGLYGSEDVVGVEIGAALKNIIAIAAGVTESMNLGHNAMSALITRGLAEISRLACAMGGRRESLAGLSGLGDLVLTCTGALSRNRHVGIELGRGRSLEEILAGMRMVAEGVRTTSAALALGEKHGVELPIAGQMAEVLAGRSRPPPRSATSCCGRSAANTTPPVTESWRHCSIESAPAWRRPRSRSASAWRRPSGFADGDARRRWRGRQGRYDRHDRGGRRRADCRRRRARRDRPASSTPCAPSAAGRSANACAGSCWRFCRTCLRRQRSRRVLTSFSSSA